MIKEFFSHLEKKKKNLFHFLEKFRQSKQGCKFLLLSKARVPGSCFPTIFLTSEISRKTRIKNQIAQK
jgi:hypothetical protein